MCGSTDQGKQHTEELAGFAGTMPTIQQHTASIFTCKVPQPSLQVSAASHSNSRYHQRHNSTMQGYDSIHIFWYQRKCANFLHFERFSHKLGQTESSCPLQYHCCFIPSPGRLSPSSLYQLILYRYKSSGQVVTWNQKSSFRQLCLNPAVWLCKWKAGLWKPFSIVLFLYIQ